MKKVAVIIPVFNEEKYLPNFLKKLLPQVKKIPEINRIVFVNDGSTDKTQGILEKAKKQIKRILIIRLKNDNGKGNAMRVGSQEAIKRGAKYLIYMDGDGQHDPKHLTSFIKELANYPLVFGYRKLEKNTPLIRKIGNKISSFIIRNVFRIERVGDILCGYFAIHSAIYKKIKWHSDDYGVEAEISTIVSREKIPFKEILVKTIYLDRTKGVNLFHALNIFLRIPFWAIIRHMDRTLKILTLFGLALIFLLLAFKNPYSVRSLVPNLEPYPDTLYYSSPAWNFVQSKGFVMQAFDYQSKIVTPPLYSIFLMPFFAVFQDVRSFYFANLLLMVGSLALFVLILSRLVYTKLADILIVGLVGFFFATNFYFYTQPYLLMAESITLFFSMLAMYLLVASTTPRRSFWAGLLGIAILMIKFSNLPLTLAFYILYGWKILKDPSKKNSRIFGLSLGLSLLLLASYSVKTQIFAGHKNLSSGAGFSPVYFLQNFQQYLKTLMGGQERYLWFDNRMTSPLLAIPTFIGILVGLFIKKWRKNTILLLVYGFSVIIFMSFFYTRDIRYIIVVYPIMLIFTGFTFLFVKERFGKVVGIVLTVLLGVVYLLLPQSGQVPGERPIITLKKQVGLNFRHAEEPWNYKAVVEFNSFFSQSKDKKPYFGTLLPPYFVGYYTNGNYNYLPVSMGQEFFGDKKKAPKVFLTLLVDYYKMLLEAGNEIYISPYYQANLLSWKQDYDNLAKNFNLELVKSGCHNTCNIYKLTLLK